MRRIRSFAPALPAILVIGLIVVLAPAVLAGEQTAPTAERQPLAQDDLVAQGAALFATGCSTCHGPRGDGTDLAPTLVGVGAASADFQLRTGRMPFAGRPGQQAERKEPAYDDAQIRALVAFVASLGNGPEIPEVQTDDALVARGQELFVGNCAPCHGATANGGAVGGGSLAPNLHVATPTQVVEAMLTGPGQMPVFRLDPRDADAVATYVTFLQRGENPGGLSIGGIGPVPEGLVGWLLGLGLIIVLVRLVARDWSGGKIQNVDVERDA